MRVWFLCSIFLIGITTVNAQVSFVPEKEVTILKDSLGLTAWQSEKILLILHDVKEELTDLHAIFKNKPDDFGFAFSQTLANARARIAALLREEQAKQFKEIKLLVEKEFTSK